MWESLGLQCPGEACWRRSAFGELHLLRFRCLPKVEQWLWTESLCLRSTWGSQYTSEHRVRMGLTGMFSCAKAAGLSLLNLLSRILCSNCLFKSSEKPDSSTAFCALRPPCLIVSSVISANRLDIAPCSFVFSAALFGAPSPTSAFDAAAACSACCGEAEEVLRFRRTLYPLVERVETRNCLYRQRAQMVEVTELFQGM